MATPDIATGTAAGLMDFMDFMIDKGYAKPSAITPWKSAAKQVFSTLEGEDFGGLEVRNLDVDDYFARFENRSMGKYSADSLTAYRSRFRKAVDSYQSYLQDPNWKPSAGTFRRATGRPTTSTGGTAATHDETASAAKSSAPSPSLITYPFPLRSGQVAQLHLPTQLDQTDAERLVHFVRALVFDPPRQLPSGSPDEETT